MILHTIVHLIFDLVRWSVGYATEKINCLFLYNVIVTSINLTFHSLSCCSSFYHSLSYNLLCLSARAYFFVCFATYGCWHPCDILTSKTHNTLIVPFLASCRFFISIFIVLFLSIRNCFHCLDSSSSFLVYSWIWRARPTIHFFYFGH